MPDKLTSDGGDQPVLSPDGHRVVFLNVVQSGTVDLYVQDTVPGAPAERVLSTPSLKSPTDLSSHGHLLFQEISEERRSDVWVLSLDGDQKPRPVANSRAAESAGQFRPDGKWVTYTSDINGRPEVYAQPFPGPGTAVQVSRGGGRDARWRDDGLEIFYLAPDNSLNVVAVRTSRDGKSLEFEPPRPLFMTRVPEGQGPQRLPYGVADRGRKFLIQTIRDDAPEPITLIQNWKPER